MATVGVRELRQRASELLRRVEASVLRTATQQQRDPVAILVGLLRAPGPVVADLVIPGLARGP